jgi:hypothetical protein
MVKIIFFILFLACNLLKIKVPVINEKLLLPAAGEIEAVKSSD